MTFSSGYGDLSEEGFRISHMGEDTVEGVKNLISTVEEATGL